LPSIASRSTTSAGVSISAMFMHDSMTSQIFRPALALAPQRCTRLPAESSCKWLKKQRAIFIKEIQNGQCHGIRIDSALFFPVSSSSNPLQMSAPQVRSVSETVRTRRAVAFKKGGTMRESVVPSHLRPRPPRYKPDGMCFFYTSLRLSSIKLRSRVTLRPSFNSQWLRPKGVIHRNRLGKSPFAHADTP
jgi:hypothetical protein